MKTTYNLIRSLRLSVSVPAGLLVHIGYKLSHQSTNWLLAFIITAICGLTMLTNDYFDREHDKKKGKHFVSENVLLVVFIISFGWSAVLVLSWLRLSHTFPIYLSALVVICIFYSYSRYVFLLPILIVSSMSAFPVLLPALDAPYYLNTMFFAIIFVGIFSREIIKDVEDKDVDKGYKKTLATELKYYNKDKLLLWISGYCIFCCALLCSVILAKLATPQTLICGAGMALLLLSAYFLFFPTNLQKGKKFFDLGMASIVIALSI